MIARDMQEYNLYQLGELDEYGQAAQPANVGTITAAVYERSQSVTDSVLFTDCEYIALTNESITDSNAIAYDGKLLKVMYVMRRGYFMQAFCKDTGASV